MTETELTKTQDEPLEEDESSVDNFFAKKDKSKKPKKKKKGTKTDETVPGTKSEKPPKQGDDWNDFEEEKEKDYSSLKIQSLQVADENGQENEEEIGEEGDEEDGGKKKTDGKWNVPTPAQESVPAEPEAPNLPGTHNVVGGKYVPPSVKRSNMMSMGAKVNTRKPLSAPDIQSKAAFPTLSAANQDLSAPNRPTDFEAVRGGLKTREARVDGNQSGLELGNRYGSLGN